MKKTIEEIIFFAFLFLWVACNSREKKELGLPIIPVNVALEKEDILYLKNYVSDIHYIRLSTTEDVLIKSVNQMYCDDEKIIILTRFDNCKIFDKEGNFKFSIGKIGQGPEEYVFCRDFDLLPKSDQIMLFPRPCSVLFYNMDGNFLKKMNTKSLLDSNAYFSYRTMCLKPGIFVSDILPIINHNVKFLIYSDSIIKKIPHNLDLSGRSEMLHNTADIGILYRFQNEIIHYKPFEDTIFRINVDLEYKPYFVFEYGKYKYSVEVENNQHHKIYFDNIQESDRYLFLESVFLGYKNAFEYIDEDGRKRRNVQIYGIFDKETGKLNFLRHPEPGKLGFKNDVDDGLPFWPKYISPKGEMITYYQPDEFMEAFQNKKDIPEDVKVILKDLKEDDNPIVAIAKLK